MAIKKLMILCVCGDSRELELWYTAERNGKLYTFFGKQVFNLLIRE
jgi:hypothetical protein